MRFLVSYYVSGEVQMEAEDKEDAERMVRKALNREGVMPKEATCHARALDDIPVFVVRGES